MRANLAKVVRRLVAARCRSLELRASSSPDLLIWNLLLLNELTQSGRVVLRTIHILPLGRYALARAAHGASARESLGPSRRDGSLTVVATGKVRRLLPAGIGHLSLELLVERHLGQLVVDRSHSGARR